MRPINEKEVISASPPKFIPVSIKKLLSGSPLRDDIRKERTKEKEEQRPLYTKSVARAIPDVYPAREGFPQQTVEEEFPSPPAPVQSRLPEQFEQGNKPEETRVPPSESTQKDQEKIEGRAAPIRPIFKVDPKYKLNPIPSYPLSAKRRGFEGSSLLRVEVLANGRVGRITLLRSAGYPILDRSAIKTVKKWLFEPAREGDRPIAMWIRIPIVFKLD
jgi:protein TonB